MSSVTCSSVAASPLTPRPSPHPPLSIAVCCGGWLRSFLYRGGEVSEARDWPVANVGNIVSFGQDGQNELYVLSAAGGVYRIVAAP